MIIRYMYTGILDLKEKTGSDILDLLVTSDELLIEELVIFVQKYLIEIKPNEFICEDSEPFFDSPEFSMLEKTQASELEGKNVTDLSQWNKNDFLILKNILNPYIRYIRFFNVSSKDFHNSIWPFKRILPETLFEDIISLYLTDTQPEKNTLPPRCGKITIDSAIIKLKHAIILAKWTQRKDANSKIQNGKYCFNRVYRGSRDGFDINTMRSKCNGQGACIVVIKVKENGAIIGGYNPLGWTYYNNTVNNGLHNNVNNNNSRYNAHYNKKNNYRASLSPQPINTFMSSNCMFGTPQNQLFAQNTAHNNNNNNQNYWRNTTESFIFSLDDGEELKKFKISRVTNNDYAIYESNHMNIALNFGNSDMVINGTNGSCNRSYYESDILDTNHFSIEEMEIFGFYKS
ncbi:hypothetical protein RclHR1_03130001 [Rhizophagus clarus]|uniref:BTB/POZ protein n=1 Tax=Rhizophagus clarus TaxID=94130 RepID=A0A2Z6R7I5_9GLOM|nr:hypothetical protein RclHR1_03130001 [Rhizophagus clarus]GES81817.1 BTB/POZ protein [Rhizophagus clarus]